MSTVSPAPYVTFEAFLEAEEKSDGRHEWLDGVVYDVSRGTPEHARLSAAVAAELRASLKGDCVVYGSEAMLYVADTRFSTYADAIASSPRRSAASRSSVAPTAATGPSRRRRPVRVSCSTDKR